MQTKILIIEDDTSTETLLQKYLGLEGFDVVLLPRDDQMEQVIEGIQLEKPDLLLMDVYLRQLNGFEVLAAIRKNSQFKDLRVIMCSGAEFGERCAKEGADAFMLKPYMPEDLIRTMHRLLNGQRKKNGSE
jgi:DNA-binding response OmpR family regulator